MPESIPHFVNPDKLRAHLARSLETGPLYKRYYYSDATDTKELPHLISLSCPICRTGTFWQKVGYGGSRVKDSSATYVCRNCQVSRIQYSYSWYDDKTQFVFYKWGQDPELEDSPPLDVSRSLSEADLAFYKKALRCRNFSYGMGAMIYMRRVIENSMNILLETLVEIARGNQVEEAVLTKLGEVKNSKRFTDKVAYGKLLVPARLIRDGTNPMDVLHDACSEAVHALSEDESVDLFDRSMHVFNYFFAELRIEKEREAQFVKGLRDLATRK